MSLPPQISKSVSLVFIFSLPFWYSTSLARDLSTNNPVKYRNPFADLKGVVKDAAGQVIAGVTVQVKGKRAATQTNVNGQFTLQANTGDVLVFSYVGYLSKEVTITGTDALAILMENDPKNLGEVIVTALGIKKRKKILRVFGYGSKRGRPHPGERRKCA